MTATQCATVDPPIWPPMQYDAGADDRGLGRLRNFLFGKAEDDDNGHTYPTGHYCFYRALAEGALDIITVVDEFGTIVYKSPSTETHLGYSPDELIGRNLFEFVHSDDIPRVRAAFDDCRKNDTASAPIEHRLRHTDGLWRTFESVGRFQADGTGGRIGIIHSRDVGARKLLEAQVRQAQKMEAVDRRDRARLQQHARRHRRLYGAAGDRSLTDRA
jgi:PAS domain S-box-containing protein